MLLFLSVVEHDIKTISIAVGVTVGVLIIVAITTIVLCLLYKKRFDCFLWWHVVAINCRSQGQGVN